MFPFHKPNTLNQSEQNLTAENEIELLQPLTSIQTTIPENEQPITNKTNESTKNNKTNIIQRLLNLMNPNMKTIENDLEFGLDKLDSVVDKLPISKKSSKYLHIILGIIKNLLIFIFALFSIAGVISLMLHFHPNANQITQNLKCLLDDTCDGSDLILDPQNDIYGGNSIKTYIENIGQENELPSNIIYPNEFEEFQKIINLPPKNSSVFMLN